MTRHPLDDLLGLSTPAIAIAFLDAAPPGLRRVAAVEAAGCGYWRRAAAGEAFYTEASDHLNCPVGAHTHGVPTTPEQQADLMGLIQTMVGLEYLRMEEVAAIPRRQGRFGVVAYAPLAACPFPPELVLVRGDVRQLMLLAEAAQAAGLGSDAPTLGRPTCAVLPQALASGRSGASFGCVGNRVYTGAGPGEGYFALPGSQVDALVQRLGVVVRANRQLEGYHRGRRAALAPSAPV